MSVPIFLIALSVSRRMLVRLVFNSDAFAMSAASFVSTSSIPVFVVARASLRRARYPVKRRFKGCALDKFTFSTVTRCSFRMPAWPPQKSGLSSVTAFETICQHGAEGPERIEGEE